MLSTSRDVRRTDSQITADNYTFDTVKEIIYLDSAVLTKNDVSLEIKRRTGRTNRCYYGLDGQLSSKGIARTTKLILYKTLILPVLLYDVEASFYLFDRKVLRKIFGPVLVSDNFGIRFNSDLYELINDIDVVQCINIQRLRCLGKMCCGRPKSVNRAVMAN